MAQTTFANQRGIVHTKSGGKSVAFPDPCLTKVGKPIVPVPIPTQALQAIPARGRPA